MTDRSSYTEKRNFIRMKVNAPAQVFPENQETAIEGLCNDLSGSGMLLTLDKNLPVDSDIVVTLSSGDGKSPILKAKCSVARTQVTEEDRCMLGLEILEIFEDTATTQ